MCDGHHMFICSGIHKLIAFMVGIGSKSGENAPLSMYLNSTPKSKAATFLANVKAVLIRDTILPNLAVIDPATCGY